MNRKELRAIAQFKSNPDHNLTFSGIKKVDVGEAPRDKHRGTYKLNQSGGAIQVNWIGRSNSINQTNIINVGLSGNLLYGDR